MRTILGVGAVLLVGLLTLRIPIPAYVLAPGPVFPLADAISIQVPDGAEVQPLTGDFLFLTIQLDDARFVDVITTAANDEEELVTRASVLQGEDEDDFIARQEVLFEEAEAEAIRVGLELADSDLTADQVMIDTDGVGGPSAGLLTALAVADLASPLDLAAGRTIAGSGTLDADGSVGPVGSIEDKMRAATAAGAGVFLVPPDLLERAQAAAPSLEVIGVATVDEAFEALTDS